MLSTLTNIKFHVSIVKIMSATLTPCKFGADATLTYVSIGPGFHR